MEGKIMRPPILDTQAKGTISELYACNFLLRAGYNVYRNVSLSGPVDSLATKGGRHLAVDVKSLPAEIELRAQVRPGKPYATHRSHKLTNAQKQLRVRFLYVAADGTCNFDETALAMEIEERNIRRRMYVEKLDAEIEEDINKREAKREADAVPIEKESIFDKIFEPI